MRWLISVLAAGLAVIAQITIVDRIAFPGEAEAGGVTGGGVVVMVTVGAGRGRIEIPAPCLGTATTTPTTPRAVKVTNGWTSAVWMRAPLCTETTVPTGTPGTSGRSFTEA